MFARKAVHGALCLAVVMLSLAVLYAAQGAPFLFAVQIIVYTGAIMMLFLFVLMLVGVETPDSMRETIRGQRLLATVVGLLFGVLAITGVAQTVTATVRGFGDATARTRRPGGAAVRPVRPGLRADERAAHHRRARRDGAGAPRAAQRAADAGRRCRQQRMRDYAESGKHPGNPPTPGVFARHNAVDTPALLPDGTPLEESISASLVARGQLHEGFDDDVDAVERSSTQLEGR